LFPEDVSDKALVKSDRSRTNFCVNLRDLRETTF